MLDPAVRALLEAPNFVHLATLTADGGPASVAIWAGIHDDRPCFFTQPSSAKARNIARDPRVALSVVDRDNPYRTGRLRGVVGEIVTGEDALTIIDALSRAYTGEPFPMRSGQVYLVDVSHSAFMELPFKDTPAA